MATKLVKKHRKKIIAIDPGTTQSALVLLNPREMRVEDKIYAANETCLKWLSKYSRRGQHLAIEQIKSYGNVMGDSVLQTCVWSGRFWQAWNGSVIWIPRKTVCGHICSNARANDSMIRQALIDAFAPTGGGNTPQIGTKGCRGPLYGITGDLWAALAVAVTCDMQLREDIFV